MGRVPGRGLQWVPRQNDQTSTHARSFETFGFAHENGFFTDFKLGYGTVPMLKFGVGFTVRKKSP